MDPVESYFSIILESLGRPVAKAHISAHPRHNPGGSVSMVREHEDGRPGPKLTSRSGTHAETANRIAKHLHSMGYEGVTVHGSGLSNSHYIHGEHETGGSIRIRVSDHEAKPTYQALNGEADYEVHLGQGHQDTDGPWEDAVRYAATRAETHLPPGFEDSIAARGKARDTRKAKEESRRTEIAQRIEAERPEREAREVKEKEQTRVLTKRLAQDDAAWESAQKITSRWHRAGEGTKRRAIQDTKDQEHKTKILQHLGFGPEDARHADWDSAIERAHQSREQSKAITR